MFDKILIANRGEIACRIIKTAKRLGIKTVAVYSDADRYALHTRLADEAVYVGAAAAAESYLQQARILDAAVATGAQAIHPGYGFLSENAEFSEACTQRDIVFIGPPPSAIRAMGSKSAAKAIMEQAGVPLVPGYHGEDQSEAILKAAADEMGYPVILKAAAGGGGKGMRQVWEAANFSEALNAAKRESSKAFGDDTMLVEKYLTGPRHVEIQVFCDMHGNAVHLFERDCSVQRRHQKVIEEAPAPGMTEALRAAMGETAIQAAQAIDYVGAGTVEFLLDSDGAFYFMEMNTRLQVEHPVTEMITGQDLVEWQLQVASGGALPAAQDELSIHGHAFEARVYAEDPANDFLPQTGTLQFLQEPEKSRYVRIDTGVTQGDEISVYYDPMISKLICWDVDRDRALKRLSAALAEYCIAGLATNIRFLKTLADNPAFKNAELDTNFIAIHEQALFPDRQADGEESLQNLALASLFVLSERVNEQRLKSAAEPDSPWSDPYGWRLNATPHLSFTLHMDDREWSVEIVTLAEKGVRRYLLNIDDRELEALFEIDGNSLRARLNGHQVNATLSQHAGAYTLFRNGDAHPYSVVDADTGEFDAAAAGDDFAAPMNGTIVAHSVKAGDAVAEGDVLLIMEAMKMEHSIRAPASGKVVEFFYKSGELVDGGAQLLAFESD